MKHNLSFVIFILLFIMSCDGLQKIENPEVVISKTCSVSRRAVRFDSNICQEPRATSIASYARLWKSWAFFKSSCNNNNYSSLSVGLITVGWSGIGVFVDSAQLDSYWANKDIAYAIEIVSLDNSAVLRGPFTSQYVVLHTSNPYLTTLKVNSSGRFELDYMGSNKPKNVESFYKKGQPQRKEPDLGSFVSKNQINGAKSYAINVLIKDLNGGHMIRLIGPTLKNLAKELKTSVKEKSRVLNLAQTLNPNQEGGLWSVIKDMSKYDKCRKLHTEYRKLFNQRLANK